MRIASKMILAAGLSLAIQLPVWAADQQPAFKDAKEKASYGIGMFFANQIKRSSMEVDIDAIVAAMKTALADQETKLTDQQAQEAIRAYQQEARLKLGERNKTAGEAFLKENKQKEGIKVHEVNLPDGTKAELQYKVLCDGSGPTPKSNDVVQVNYRGTLINGKEFDSSAKHGGQPSKFPVNRVVRGWTEALQLMKVGSKWQLFIPSELAYRDTGGPGIEPNSTLIFEVELVGIEAPPTPVAAPAPAPAQPLTSDIIKVPSAEELKKGAKIEVIKAEDAARMAKEAQQKESATSAPKN